MLTIAQHVVGDVVRLLLRDKAGAPIEGLEVATVLEILARPPRGPVRVWPAELAEDGPAAAIRYELEPGDLDQAGRWHLQPHVEIPGKSLRFFAVDLVVPPSPELPALGGNLVAHSGDNLVAHSGEDLFAH